MAGGLFVSTRHLDVCLPAELLHQILSPRVREPVGSAFIRTPVNQLAFWSRHLRPSLSNIASCFPGWHANRLIMISSNTCSASSARKILFST